MVKALAFRGFDVAIAYHKSLTEAESLVAEVQAVGPRAYAVPADLSTQAGVLALFSALPDGGRGLGVVVNSAALFKRADPRTLAVEDWDATIAINLRAPFFICQQAAQLMEFGGLVVNVSDAGAGRAWSGFPVYTVSKAGLESMTRVLARAFAPEVRVNAIAPGLVLPSDEVPGEEWARLVARLPMRRAAALEEIVMALDYLIDNTYVTGQVLVVDGGYSLI
jgi:pteridine reductase